MPSLDQDSTPRRSAAGAGSTDRLPNAAAGLQGAPKASEAPLRRFGLDPRRLYAFRLGLPDRLLRHGRHPWLRRLKWGALLWAVLFGLEWSGAPVPLAVSLWGSLAVGLLILQAACDALITATERLAARNQWDHYIAGTLAEIFSTAPEFVVIGFVVPVSPTAAVVIALATIYNNALVFSLYSFFLPKDKKGYFLMPVAVTQAGTQVLIAGAAIGSVLGLLMLTLTAAGSAKDHFGGADLIVLALAMLSVFAAYLYKLVTGYAEEEGRVREALGLKEEQIAERKELIFENVKRDSVGSVVGLFVAGILAAFLGGERVASFAESAIEDLGLNEVATAILLAAFAGMSEYVILWRAHRKGQHRIALANAFGGITQVMFLVLPFTFLAVGVYQLWIHPGHPELPLHFSVGMTLLTGLLFPTCYALIALLADDHTFGILDTVIMTSICLLVLLSLAAYGS